MSDKIEFHESSGENKKSYFAKDKEINLLHSESQQMYRRLIESVKVGVYMADLKGNLFYVNDALVIIFGFLSKEDAVGYNLADILYVSEDDRREFIRRMDERGYVREFEVKIKRKDGSMIILSTTSNYMRNEEGKVIGVEGIIQDVTEHKRLEKALLTEKRKLEQILNFGEKVSSIREFDELGYFAVQETANILEAQKCSIMLLDHETDELFIEKAKGLRDQVVEETRVKLGDSISGYVGQERKPLLVKNIEYDERFNRANKSTYTGRSFISAPIELDEKLVGVINIADKHSELNNHEEVFNEVDLKILAAISAEVAAAIDNVNYLNKLNILTVTDPLTHIYNYRQFSKCVTIEMKRCSRTKRNCSLIMMDVDDFKPYNDTYGHIEGDALLKSISEILVNQLRDTDIICRYAGDEFAIILPDTDSDGALKAAEKIRKAIEGREDKREVTISQGVAVYSDGLAKEEFINKADKALYQAKSEGKNKVSVLT